MRRRSRGFHKSEMPKKCMAKLWKAEESDEEKVFDCIHEYVAAVLLYVQCLYAMKFHCHKRENPKMVVILKN